MRRPANRRKRALTPIIEGMEGRAVPSAVAIVPVDANPPGPPGVVILPSEFNRPAVNEHYPVPETAIFGVAI